MIASFALLSECDTSRTTGKGYQKIGQDVQEGCEDGDEDDPAEEEEASDDDSGSQESDTDDESDYESDSECGERKLIYQTVLWGKLWTVSVIDLTRNLLLVLMLICLTRTYYAAYLSVL